MSAQVYAAVTRQLLANSMAKLMAFRVSFILNVLVEVANFFSYYLTVSFLFDHISHVGSWGRAHFMFFVFWVQLMGCLYNCVAAPNFWNFATEVRTGALDFRLLRPLGSLFDAFTAYQRPITLLVAPIHISFIMHYGRELNFTWIAWSCLPLLFVGALLLAFLIELTVIMVTFWTGGGDGMNFVRMQCQQLQRWPNFVYPTSLRRFLTWYFPILATGTLSVQFLLDTKRWETPLFILCAIAVFWGIAGKLWARGLRRYESASS